MLILFVVFIVKREIRPIFHKLQARVGDVTIRNQNVVYPVVVSYYRSVRSVRKVTLNFYYILYY